MEKSDHYPCYRRRRDGCTECRRKKVKCDLRKPICSRCKQYPKGCSYDLKIISQSPKSPTASHPPATGYIPSVRLSHVTKPIIPARRPSTSNSPFLLSDKSKFLMHFFCTQTVDTLFPAAPKIFLEKLISAAFETPHLLYALLATAGGHYSRLTQDASPIWKITSMEYTRAAIVNLRAALCGTTPILEAETMATAMALCTTDVCNGNGHIWRTHLRGAMRLLATISEQRNGSFAKRDPFTQCLVKWFMAMDISTALSGFGGEYIHQPRADLLRKTSNQDIDGVDGICGYSLELVPVLERLLQLTNYCCNPLSAELVSDMPLSVEVIIEAEGFEAQILSLIGKSGSLCSTYHEEVIPSELQHSHLAFVHAALLHFHRRVQGLPKNHDKVRTDVRNILDAVGRINACSTANISILWPIFSAGCETDINTERDMIDSRMGSMQSLGMANFTRARQLLKEYWASNISLPWDTYFRLIGHEIVLY